MIIFTTTNRNRQTEQLKSSILVLYANGNSSKLGKWFLKAAYKYKKSRVFMGTSLIFLWLYIPVGGRRKLYKKSVCWSLSLDVKARVEVNLFGDWEAVIYVNRFKLRFKSDDEWWWRGVWPSAKKNTHRLR